MEYIGIETTQNINLEFKAASVGDRILAIVFDLLVQLVWIFSFLFLFGGSDALQLWHSVFSLPVLFYSLIGELFFNGQTLGKMVFKTRVVKLDGSELSLGDCLARWIFRIVDIAMLWGTVALLVILFSKKGQRIGDFVAGTTVVKINTNNLLEETSYVEVPDDYTPMFKQVYLLSDNDVQIIKEVLNMHKVSVKKPWIVDPVLLKTRQAIQKKIAVDLTDMSSKEFLESILLDYNHLHQ